MQHSHVPWCSTSGWPIEARAWLFSRMKKHFRVIFSDFGRISCDFRLYIRDFGKKKVRSRETRKTQGNLEAAVKGNSHGGLAGMGLAGKDVDNRTYIEWHVVLNMQEGQASYIGDPLPSESTQKKNLYIRAAGGGGIYGTPNPPKCNHA